MQHSKQGYQDLLSTFLSPTERYNNLIISTTRLICLSVVHFIVPHLWLRYLHFGQKLTTYQERANHLFLDYGLDLRGSNFHSSCFYARLQFIPVNTENFRLIESSAQYHHQKQNVFCCPQNRLSPWLHLEICIKIIKITHENQCPTCNVVPTVYCEGIHWGRLN